MENKNYLRRELCKTAFRLFLEIAMLGRFTRVGHFHKGILHLRTFSRLTAAFDLSRNPAHWPQPLKSRSCDSVSLNDVASTVTLSGWVDSVRVMKDSVFIVLRDSNGKVQTLFPCDKEGVLKWSLFMSSRRNSKVNSSRKLCLYYWNCICFQCM